MKEFKLGDKVSLISGGPTMTIGKFNFISYNTDSTEAVCYYFPCDSISDDGIKFKNYHLLEQCIIPLAALQHSI
jgi:hypothetical protein